MKSGVSQSAKELAEVVNELVMMVIDSKLLKFSH